MKTEPNIVFLRLCPGIFTGVSGHRDLPARRLTAEYYCPLMDRNFRRDWCETWCGDGYIKRAGVRRNSVKDASLAAIVSHYGCLRETPSRTRVAENDRHPGYPNVI